MKVSVITATLNNEDTITDCIRNLQSQTYADIEHIVVDGVSKDSTLHIINEISPESILISEPDKGIYDALNKGISRASGDLIGFLHADDLFASDQTIEHMVAAIKANSADGVYGDLCYLRQDGRIQRRWTSAPFQKKMIGQGWMPPHPTLFLTRRVYAEFGLFDESLRISADYDFILRIFMSGDLNLAYLPETLVHMRTGGVSNRSLSTILQKSREDYKVLRRNKLPFPLLTLLRKNLSKLPQFFSSRD